VADGPRILVVDDNEVNLDVLGRRLERKGCRITTALDGPAALELLELQPFDAVVLDLQMPGMSGLEVLAAIREKRSQLAMPVIMATAQTDPEMMVSALEAGANDYVTKPIDVDVLYARLRAQLRGSEVARREKASDTSPGAGAAAGPGGAQVGFVLAGKYRLDEVLGMGGFGSVYRARHLVLDSDVAVKVLHPHLARATGVVRRFAQEGVSACRVKHPNAVAVLDAGSDGEGLPFLVMELLSGPTLSEALEREGMLPLGRTVDIITPVCEVLEEAHRVGIVHRDVKPANIMLSQGLRGEVVKVLDFGISKFIDREKQLGLTGDGIAGTPLYMSPEALLGRPTEAPSDVFSVGVTLFVMLGGEPPYGPPAKSPFEQAIRQVNTSPTSLATLRPDLPREVVQIVMSTLARDPDHRPFLGELRDALALMSSMFTEPEWPPVRAVSSRARGLEQAATVHLHLGTLGDVSTETSATGRRLATDPDSGVAPGQSGERSSADGEPGEVDVSSNRGA
jgi:serine/threonine protein kinase